MEGGYTDQAQPAVILLVEDDPGDQKLVKYALQFQKHFLGLGIQGGLLGAVPVFAVTFGLARFAEYQPDLWLPGNGVPLINYSVLILPPVIAALLTMATARIAVLRILRQMN